MRSLSFWPNTFYKAEGRRSMYVCSVLCAFDTATGCSHYTLEAGDCYLGSMATQADLALDFNPTGKIWINSGEAEV